MHQCRQLAWVSVLRPRVPRVRTGPVKVTVNLSVDGSDGFFWSRGSVRMVPGGLSICFCGQVELMDGNKFGPLCAKQFLSFIGRGCPSSHSVGTDAWNLHWCKNASRFFFFGENGMLGYGMGSFRVSLVRVPLLVVVCLGMSNVMVCLAADLLQYTSYCNGGSRIRLERGPRHPVPCDRPWLSGVEGKEGHGGWLVALTFLCRVLAHPSLPSAVLRVFQFPRVVWRVKPRVSSSSCCRAGS